MIFPIGNDNDTVWRTPWVTFVIIGLNVLFFIVTYPIAERQESKFIDKAIEARDYVKAHPRLLNENTLDELRDAGLMTPTEIKFYKLLLSQLSLPNVTPDIGDQAEL